MPIMQEAMSKADFERMEQGLRPIKRKVIPRPEPTPPKLDNVMKCDDVPIDRFVRLLSSERLRLKNEEGVNFIYYKVAIELKGKETKKKPLEIIVADEAPKETYTLSGYFPEGEWEKFKRFYRDKLSLGQLQMM